MARPLVLRAYNAETPARLVEITDSPAGARLPAFQVAQSNSLSRVFLPQNSYKLSKIQTGCKGAFGLWIWDGVWIRDLGWSLDLGLVWS